MINSVFLAIICLKHCQQYCICVCVFVFYSVHVFCRRDRQIITHSMDADIVGNFPQVSQGYKKYIRTHSKNLCDSKNASSSTTTTPPPLNPTLPHRIPPPHTTILLLPKHSRNMPVFISTYYFLCCDIEVFNLACILIFQMFERLCSDIQILCISFYCFTYSVIIAK